MAVVTEILNYIAYQLKIISSFECPELLPYTPEAGDLPIVILTYGTIPSHLNKADNRGVTFEANAQEFLLRVKNVATYYITGGERIVIQKEPQASEEEMRLFLFGSAIGALLQQRGLLTLHASAISTPKGAVLFCGNSGAGKSTTLNAMLQRGYKKLSDDTIALTYDKTLKQMLCLSAYPQSKLWQQSADMFDLDTNVMRQIRPEMQKFAHSTVEHFQSSALPLYAVVALRAHHDVTCNIKEVDAAKEKFTLLLGNTYRKRFLTNLPQSQQHFFSCTQAANQARVFQLVRSLQGNSLQKVCDLIEANVL